VPAFIITRLSARSRVKSEAGLSSEDGLPLPKFMEELVPTIRISSSDNGGPQDYDAFKLLAEAKKYSRGGRGKSREGSSSVSSANRLWRDGPSIVKAYHGVLQRLGPDIVLPDYDELLLRRSARVFP